MADRIIAEINRPFQIDGYEIIVGASVGVARLYHDGLTLETLLSNADLALYAAKAEGRNRWRCYERQLGLHAQSRRTLEIDLRAAVANETIEVHYQPINKAATREMVGCEALVRWRHPTRGYISPAEFIPIAEELGLMDELGRTVLRRACAACASWPSEVFVAVNLSPLQVRGGRMANTIKEALEIPASRRTVLKSRSPNRQFCRTFPRTRQTLRLIRAHGRSYFSRRFRHRAIPASAISILSRWTRSRSIDPSRWRSVPISAPRSLSLASQACAKCSEWKCSSKASKRNCRCSSSTAWDRSQRCKASCSAQPFPKETSARCSKRAHSAKSPEGPDKALPSSPLSGLADAVTGAPGFCGALAMRTWSPSAMPSGGVAMTRSSAVSPEPISISAPRSRAIVTVLNATRSSALTVATRKPF